MLQYIVFIGGAINLAGSATYFRDTLRGDTKPNRVTWLMWTVAPFIATVAAVSAGATFAAVPIFMSGFIPLLILIASFVNRKAYWKLEKFDYICGACSVLALILWGVTKDPLIAIIFALLSDAFAAVPTLIKAWKYPETETAMAYLAGLINALTFFFAIKTWSITEYLFPIYLIMINIFLFVSVMGKRIFKNRSK